MSQAARARNPGRGGARRVALVLLGLALSCTEEARPGPAAPEPLPPLAIPAGCNPLAAPWDCLLPFPSDVFLAPDATLPSGRRVAIPARAALRDVDGEVVDFLADRPADGFSHLAPLLALFPAGVRPSDLVSPPGDLAASLDEGSRTIVIDASTGERLLHLAELDPNAPADAGRALIVRPLAPLSHGTRHVVALRDLHGHDGALLEPPEGFRRLRDRVAAGDPVLEPLARRYEDEVFPVLAAAGVARDELQLAWDFTTGSEESVTRDMLDVRAATMAAFEANPPAVEVTSVLVEPNEDVARELRGRMTVPLFLEADEPGAALHRDAAGRVVANGTTSVPFVALLPRSVAGDPARRPAPVLQYGHGFFGSTDETVDEFVRSLGNRLGMVVAGVDWVGMSRQDSGQVAGAILTDTSHAFAFTDRVHQAMANQLALGYALRGPLRAEPDLQVDGAPAIDPDRLYFVGNSEGHILGGTFLALAPHVERGVLGVGGCNFSFIMFRARPFEAFLLLINERLPDALDQQKLSMLAQGAFDRIDPCTYARHVTRDGYPGGPVQRRVLLHAGIGDAAVNPLAAHVHARALGATHLTPAPRPVPGLPAADGPLDGSALVEFDFHVPEPLPGTEARIPGEDTPVHEGVRRLDAAIRQIDAFLRPGGLVEPTCDGPCDPE